MKSKRQLPVVFVALALASTPLFGEIYEMAIGRRIGSGFWSPKHPEYIEGFIFSCLFYATAAIIFFYPSKKIRSFFILYGIIFLFDIIIGAWENLIINIIFIVAVQSVFHTIILINSSIRKSVR